MGKITSIYLTENEAKQLEKFCEENQCTQYSALKTALRELLSTPIKEEETSTLEERETAPQSEVMEETEEAKKKQEIMKSNLRKLAHALKAQDRELNLKSE